VIMRQPRLEGELSANSCAEIKTPQGLQTPSIRPRHVQAPA
jgi:hypothetical protein